MAKGAGVLQGAYLRSVRQTGAAIVAGCFRSRWLLKLRIRQQQAGCCRWRGSLLCLLGQAAYQWQFQKVAFRRVAATNQFFNGTAQYQAEQNSVELIDQNSICELLARFPVRRLELEQSLAFS